MEGDWCNINYQRSFGKMGRTLSLLAQYRIINECQYGELYLFTRIIIFDPASDTFKRADTLDQLKQQPLNNTFAAKLAVTENHLRKIKLSLNTAGKQVVAKINFIPMPTTAERILSS
jgi:hypothetical protein